MPCRPRFFLFLGVLFALEWVALAIRPRYRGDWAVENVLLAVGIVVLAVSFRRLPLSCPSYILIFVFLSLHQVGAHYTYSEVPYDRWFQALTGDSLNRLLGWRRNHFDRFVHLG